MCDCGQGGTCNGVTGICKCGPGFTGPKCSMDCPSGTWGEGCANVCECNWSTTDTCDAQNGQCICKAGYTGDHCSKACQNGQWGPGCQYQCQCRGYYCDKEN